MWVNLGQSTMPGLIGPLIDNSVDFRTISGGGPGGVPDPRTISGGSPGPPPKAFPDYSGGVPGGVPDPPPKPFPDYSGLSRATPRTISSNPPDYLILEGGGPGGPPRGVPGLSRVTPRTISFLRGTPRGGSPGGSPDLLFKFYRDCFVI